MRCEVVSVRSNRDAPSLLTANQGSTTSGHPTMSVICHAGCHLLAEFQGAGGTEGDSGSLSAQTSVLASPVEQTAMLSTYGPHHQWKQPSIIYREKWSPPHCKRHI